MSVDSTPAPTLIRAPRGIHRVTGLVSRMGTFALVELQKLRHDRTELFTRMVQPALWLLIFGQTFSHLHVIDIFVLLPPLSPLDMYAAYVLGAMVRGLVVGLGVFIVTLLLTPGPVAMAHPLWALAFAVLGSAILGTLGLIAGISADKFDELAAFQNFLIMPLTFLSGVFYSIHTLPPFWQVLSHFNPFFYMIDGFRYGFFGLSDVRPGLSLALVAIAALILAGVALLMLGRGWKLRH